MLLREIWSQALWLVERPARTVRENSRRAEPAPTSKSATPVVPWPVGTQPSRTRPDISRTARAGNLSSSRRAGELELFVVSQMSLATARALAISPNTTV